MEESRNPYHREVQRYGVKQEKNGKIIQKTMRPGYPESFARKLVKETGDWYVVPENK